MVQVLILLFVLAGSALGQVLQPGNGGTGTGTAPTSAQILVGDGSGNYAPQSVSGSCTLSTTGVLLCSGGGVPVISSFSPACNGTTDDSAVFVTAQATYNEIYIDANKNCAIGTNTVLTMGLRFLAGAKLTIKTGVTLTLAGKVTAPLSQIFVLQGTGKVVFGNTTGGNTQRDSWPEWFGAVGDGTTDDTAALQAAITSQSNGLGTIAGPSAIAALNGTGWLNLSAKVYQITSPLVVASSYFGIRGAGMRASIIRQGTTNADIIQVTGTGSSSSQSAVWNRFQDFAVMRSAASTGTPAGFRFTYAQWNFVDRVESWDSAYGFYFVNNVGNLRFQSSQAVNSIVGNTMTAGYYFNGPQVSTRLTDCVAVKAAGTMTYGAYISSASVLTDLFLDKFETAAVTNGIYITGLAGDVLLTDPIIETATNAIYITGSNSTGTILIKGGYYNKSPITINNSRNVQVIGGLFNVNTSSNAVLINGGSLRNSVIGITAQVAAGTSTAIPIVIDGTSGTSENIISNNNLSAPVGTPGNAAIYLYNGAVRNTVTGNAVSGYFSEGLHFDATSNNNPYVSNSIDPANVTTPINDLGTGNGGTLTNFSAGALSPLFTTSVATATSTPALSFALSTAASHTFFGNNTGSTAAPAFSSIGTGDLPYTYSGTGTELATATGTFTSGNCVKTDASHNFVDAGAVCGSGGGTVTTTGTPASGDLAKFSGATSITNGVLAADIVNLFSACSGTQYLGADGACHNASGSGTVTSVGLSLPADITVTGSPVTTSGTLTGAWANENANVVHAGPSTGAAAAPTWRALVTADLPFTYSGNTTKLGTVAAGSLTSGHLATWDASGNLQDGGAPGSGNYVNVTSSITWTNCTVTSGVCATTGSVSSVTAASIPGTYSNLIVIYRGVSSAVSSFNCQFNGDTAANYAYEGLQIQSTTSPTNVSGVSQTSLRCGLTGTLAGGGRFELPFYAGSGPKTVTTSGGAFNSVSSATNNFEQIFNGMWNSSSAITQIVIAPASGTFSTGFSVSVYGTN